MCIREVIDTFTNQIENTKAYILGQAPEKFGEWEIKGRAAESASS